MSDESPFASPELTDPEASVSQLVGDRIYKALCYLQWVYLAMALQLASFIALPIAGALSARFYQSSPPPIWIDFAFYSGLGLLQLFSAYRLFRLMAVIESNVLTLIGSTLLAMCPCIGMFVLVPVAETVRESLEKQGVPFRRSGPDWNALREMAANVPQNQENSPSEKPP